MSTNEFRQGRRGNDTARGGSQRNSSNNTSRDGNASQSQQNRRGKQQQQNVNRPPQQQQAQQSETSAPNGPTLPTEQHVPLNGFNAAEVEKFLAQGVEPRVHVYKLQPNSEAAKSGNPWGAKPGNMANGKDFWLELRKQVTTMQKQAAGGFQGG